MIEEAKKSGDVTESNAADEAMDADPVETDVIRPSQDSLKALDLDEQLRNSASFPTTPISQRTTSSIFSLPRETDLRQPLASSSISTAALRADANLNIEQDDNIELHTEGQTRGALTSPSDVALSAGVISNEMLSANETEQVSMECQDKLQANTLSCTTEQTDQERKEGFKSISTKRQDSTSAFPASDIEKPVLPSMQMRIPADGSDYVPNVTSSDCVVTSLPRKPRNDASNSNINWSSKKRAMIHETLKEIR